MDRLKKLSKDEIRSEVSKLNSKLKLIKSVEIKKMKKQQMIDFLMEHESDNPQNNNNHKIKEINLGEIFPFEKSTFSDYDEFNGLTRYTIYENESNSINFDDYMENIDKRN